MGSWGVYTHSRWRTTKLTKLAHVARVTGPCSTPDRAFPSSTLPALLSPLATESENPASRPVRSDMPAIRTIKGQKASQCWVQLDDPQGDTPLAHFQPFQGCC